MGKYVRKTNRVYKKRTGAPTKYRPEFCQQAIDYFTDGYKNKKSRTFPTFEELSIILNVDDDTIVEWVKTRKEFSAAYRKCKSLQKIALVESGANGSIREGWAKFLGINCCGMAEKTEVALEHSGGVDLSGGIQISWTNETLPHTQGGKA